MKKIKNLVWGKEYKIVILRHTHTHTHTAGLQIFSFGIFFASSVFGSSSNNLVRTWIVSFTLF